MIKKWHVLVCKQAVRARLPFATALRRIKRRMTGYQPHPSNIGSTIEDLATLHALMTRNGVGFHGTVLEIGTGWFPMAGIIARIAGAERVILTDITPNMDQGTFLTARDLVLKRLDQLGALFRFDVAPARALLERCTSAAALNLVYMAPFRLADVPDNSIDIVMSRACLEHIPTPDLRSLMEGLRPKLRADGVMAHAIDNGDHLAYADPGLSRLNFLTWTERTHELIWRLTREGSNRLRHHEYAGLFRDAGYVVADEDSLVHAQTRHEVDTLPLVAPYDSMTSDQLAIITSWFLLRQPDPAAMPASGLMTPPAEIATLIGGNRGEDHGGA